MNKNEIKGFTLVEVLTVLAVIGVLVAVLLPVLARVREKGNQATCQSNIKQMSLALRQYVSDNDSTYVSVNNWQEALLPYVKDNQIYECPSDSTSGNSSRTGLNTDYSFNSAFLNTFRSGKYAGVNEAAHGNLDTAKLVTFTDSIFGISDDQLRLAVVTNSCGDYAPSTRHSGGANWGFADGHVKWLAPQAAADTQCSLGLPPR